MVVLSGCGRICGCFLEHMKMNLTAGIIGRARTRQIQKRRLAACATGMGADRGNEGSVGIGCGKSTTVDSGGLELVADYREPLGQSKTPAGSLRYGVGGRVTPGLLDPRPLLPRSREFCGLRNILRRLLGLGLGSSALASSGETGI
jgi:hypothetical protein